MTDAPERILAAARRRRVHALANDLRAAPLPMTLVHHERVELAEYLLDLGYSRPIRSDEPEEP